MDDGNERAQHILAQYPRGQSASPQNLFRSVLYMGLSHFLRD